jgi:hypothetical protein
MLAYHLMDSVLTSIYFFRPILGWKGFEIFESINGCLLFHWNPSLDGMPVSSLFHLTHCCLEDHMNLFYIN